MSQNPYLNKQESKRKSFFIFSPDLHWKIVDYFNTDVIHLFFSKRSLDSAGLIFKITKKKKNKTKQIKKVITLTINVICCQYSENIHPPKTVTD